MPYKFTPPTIPEGPIGGHRLFQFRTLDRGITVIRTGQNQFIEIRFPTEDYLRGRVYWLGGRSHEVDDAMAAELMLAGYSEYLEEIV